MKTFKGYVAGKPDGISTTVDSERGIYSLLTFQQDGKLTSYTLEINTTPHGQVEIYLQDMQTGEVVWEKNIGE